MMDAMEALADLLRLMDGALGEAGFRAAEETPDPDEKKTRLSFVGQAGSLRLELYDGKAALLYCNRPAENAADGDFGQLALSLLDLRNADDRDIKYIAEEFGEALREKFTPRKGGSAAAKKLPKSISKTAVKNGDAYYDAFSFANSLTGIFPELRAAYKANFETYGEFLSEEFFQQVGNQAIHETIRRNDPLQMRRMFNLFNDVFENGVNEAQSLIAVTILGSLGNDQTLLANCVDYMSSDLAPVVIRVNKILASPSGNTFRTRLAHPPLYKPKREKRPGLMQRLIGGPPPGSLGQ
ncbi:MAG: hypothetical protein LBJ11_08315 [Oscillospiraceae bacterium]|jgi:hypothetical protein|nr:hypothetical protein [Oscillospiraceae bacterium]